MGQQVFSGEKDAMCVDALAAFTESSLAADLVEAVLKESMEQLVFGIGACSSPAGPKALHQSGHPIRHLCRLSLYLRCRLLT